MFFIEKVNFQKMSFFLLKMLVFKVAIHFNFYIINHVYWDHIYYNGYISIKWYLCLRGQHESMWCGVGWNTFVGVSWNKFTGGIGPPIHQLPPKLHLSALVATVDMCMYTVDDIHNTTDADFVCNFCNKCYLNPSWIRG